MNCFSWGAACGIAAASFACGETTAPAGLEDPGAAHDAASVDAGDAPADAHRDAASERDARSDASHSPHERDARPPAGCDEGEPCAEGAVCSENDGAVFRRCTCSAGALACLVRTPTAPSACRSGEACGASDECATDDGTTATYCFCANGTLTCNALSNADPACNIDAVMCAGTAPPGATRWMRCFKRDSASALAVTCDAAHFGLGSSGVVLTETCPETPPNEGTACGTGGSLACATVKAGQPCVGSCLFGKWRCL